MKQTRLDIQLAVHGLVEVGLVAIHDTPECELGDAQHAQPKVLDALRRNVARNVSHMHVQGTGIWVRMHTFFHH
jgi:hypothetical protein